MYNGQIRCWITARNWRKIWIFFISWGRGDNSRSIYKHLEELIPILIGTTVTIYKYSNIFFAATMTYKLGSICAAKVIFKVIS